MDENVQNCCRICLDVESTHVSILEDSLINLHIKSCLLINISANDDLPKSICEACVTQLNEFYNFQLNARCSQDWLESSLQEKSKKSVEQKIQFQPLPDSEYNSDSLLEFLNSTKNIEEYLNNLGKDDIPSIVNMLDGTESTEANKTSNSKSIKLPSPKKKESSSKTNTTKMGIDGFDSDIKTVKDAMQNNTSKKSAEKLSCFACKTKLDNIEKLSHHLTVCDNALRTCVYCNILFDSKQKMREHTLTHSVISPLTCNCSKQFDTKDELLKHCKNCEIDHIASMGFVYSCKQCSQTFNERFKLHKHVKKHVKKSEERVCDICGHMFMGDDVLAKHKKEEHEKLDNMVYRCKVCRFTSPDRKKIFCHVKKHAEAKVSARHLCESCGRSFANQSTLKNHALQHGPKSHKCHICDKAFPDAKLMEKHVMEHVDMVLCEKCGQIGHSYKLENHNCQ